MKILTDRQEIARALNFGLYPVLTYNEDTEEGSTAVVYRDGGKSGEMRYGCTLYRGYETEDDGVFYLLKKSVMLSARFDVDDCLKLAEKANAATISTDDEVAIVVYSKIRGTYAVYMVNAGKVNSEYSTAAKFK